MKGQDDKNMQLKSQIKNHHQIEKATHPMKTPQTTSLLGEESITTIGDKGVG